MYSRIPINGWRGISKTESTSSCTSEKYYKIHGPIFNGRKNGKWVKEIPSRNITMNIEKYKDGKLIDGKIISAFKGSEYYDNKIYCLTYTI
jgi:hypothetical protein